MTRIEQVIRAVSDLREFYLRLERDRKMRRRETPELEPASKSHSRVPAA